MSHVPIDRRTLLSGLGLASICPVLPAWAQPVSQGFRAPAVLTGSEMTLRIAAGKIVLGGKSVRAVTLNGSVPGPLLRFRQSQSARITVINELDEESSLHWHGLLVPFQMDGVPGVSFPGIKARSSFTYDFPIEQSGTYWYHGHSGLQEMMGLYAPIVIDPADPEAAPPDREHVILFSDHSAAHPARILRNLKVQPGYYNRQQQTLASLVAGKDQSLEERLAWARMRMDPTDISDVTGEVLTYLVNGHAPKDNWTGLFRPGERVMLRVINGAAMSVFNFRIPGLTLTIVAADGQAVRPVEVDEFQFSPGETYDLIVTPHEDRAYAIVGETVDRSGMALATLSPRPGLRALAPARRPRPLLTMRDMGMDMSGMAGMHHEMKMRDGRNAPQVKLGPGVETIAPMPVDRTGEPGIGLGDVGHKVLVYRDLIAQERNPDPRPPARTIEVHLTGSMDRYMWSIDGKTMHQVHEPLPIGAGERVRMKLVNDTMMAHPIHLHGHFFELVTGHGDHSPRKHTVNVLPGGTISFDVTGIEGDWAFHCHLLFHMAMGMMRIIQVRPYSEELS